MPRPAPRFESARRESADPPAKDAMQPPRPARPEASARNEPRPRRLERPEAPVRDDVRAPRREPQRATGPSAVAAPSAPDADAQPRFGSRSDPRAAERASRPPDSPPSWSSRASRSEAAAPAPRALPGEPANRVYRPRETQPGALARESQRGTYSPGGERGSARSDRGGERADRGERSGPSHAPDSTGAPGATGRGGFGRR